MKFLRYTYIILLMIFAVVSEAQVSRLANNYYANGEYEKAAELFSQIIETDENRQFYFQRLIDCLLNLKKYDEAQKLIDNEVKTSAQALQYTVLLGSVYDRKGENEKAQKEYKKAIGMIDKNVEQASVTASTFTTLGLFEEAISVYEIAQNSIKNNKLYAFNLADLYRRKGNESKMITNYLLSVEQFQSNQQYLLESLESNLSPEGYDDLQAQLYTFIQENPDQIMYPEILQWSFIHLKEYKKALRQAKAMDIKLAENGSRVFEVGNIAYNDQDFDIAIEAYSYITDNKSINSSYYLEAKRALLNAKRNKVTQRFDYTKEDLMSLDQEYNSFLAEYGRNSQTAPIMIEYADFQALFINDLSQARSTLNEVINFGGLATVIVAQAKLKLGDYFLMDGERWESSLLFSQVDKDFKEGELGEQARYRNARLSYFMGDFEWAQEQFDILKSATTRLISNDAIDMAVFIMDNLNLDTITLPMELYAQAELLIFQNKYDEAIAIMDTLAANFPDHTLQDDILYSKAQICKKRLQPLKAIEYYSIIIEKYKEEIRCDNAIYEMARMYELQLDQPEKAKELYQKLFTEHESSTFAIDARKRFRALRKEGESY